MSAANHSIPCPASRNTPEEIVSEAWDLPAAPKVLPRLKQLLCDGNTPIGEIVALVRLDPGIAARLLKVSNSAYHARNARCCTVDDAVGRVGYDAIYGLVADTVAAQVLVRPLNVYGIEADELWRMSVACGLAAEHLADLTGTDRDMAYTVGLLHGIGMVAIDSWALRHGHSIAFFRRPFPREWADSERALIGCTQAEVGAELLRTWDFPAEIGEPILWQYSPKGAGGHLKMASLLMAAKWLRTCVCATEAEVCPPPPEDFLLRPLGFNGVRLAKLVLAVRAKLHEVNSQLEEAA